MPIFELIKRLEYLIAFQTDRLNQRDWEAFDRTENEIEKIEEEIVKRKK